jgi:hypothetical protein
MADDTNDVLIQDFVAEAGVFYLGIKTLNSRSVAAARGDKGRVLSVVGKHLYREIRAETCWAGGRINPAKTPLNYSMLPGPMTAESMVSAALDAMSRHGVDWKPQRKDMIMGIELVISVPVKFKGDWRALFEKTLPWVRAEFPHPVEIVAAVVHLDEATPHMHVILVPLLAQGRMSGHEVAGYKALFNKRVNSFYKQVAQQYGLRKPRRKGKLAYRERQQLADRVLANMLAEGAAWADSKAVAAMRKLLTAAPEPMAEALGLMQDTVADEADQTTYAVDAGGVDAVLADEPTAYLCYAFDADLMLDNDADTDPTPPGHHGGASILAGDGFCLSLPAFTAAGTCESSTAPGPIFIAPDAAIAAPDDTDGRIVERDDFPSSTWSGYLGRPIPPLPTKPSRRSEVDAEVRRALAQQQARKRAA